MVGKKDLKGIDFGKRFYYDNEKSGLSAEIFYRNGFYDVFVNSSIVSKEKEIQIPLIKLNKAIKEYKLCLSK